MYYSDSDINILSDITWGLATANHVSIKVRFRFVSSFSWAQAGILAQPVRLKSAITEKLK